MAHERMTEGTFEEISSSKDFKRGTVAQRSIPETKSQPGSSDKHQKIRKGKMKLQFPQLWFKLIELKDRLMAL